MWMLVSTDPVASAFLHVVAVSGAVEMPEVEVFETPVASRRGLTVELWDSFPELPPETGSDELNLLDLDAEGGRGLLVISAYSAKHGVTQTTGRKGKTVWVLCAHDGN
jgi:hypothetical protein